MHLRDGSRQTGDDGVRPAPNDLGPHGDGTARSRSDRERTALSQETGTARPGVTTNHARGRSVNVTEALSAQGRKPTGALGW